MILLGTVVVCDDDRQRPLHPNPTRGTKGGVLQTQCGVITFTVGVMSITAITVMTTAFVIIVLVLVLVLVYIIQMSLLWPFSTSGAITCTNRFIFVC